MVDWVTTSDPIGENACAVADGEGAEGNLPCTVHGVCPPAFGVSLNWQSAGGANVKVGTV
jgi:hypothetical protein